MKALAQLVSVLCDQSGKCCIRGSDTDRQIVDDALAALRDESAQPVQPVEGAAKYWHDRFRKQSLEMQDQAARLGAEIVRLEIEIEQAHGIGETK